MGQFLSKFALLPENLSDDEPCPWFDDILGPIPTSFEENENVVFLSKVHDEGQIVTISDED